MDWALMFVDATDQWSSRMLSRQQMLLVFAHVCSPKIDWVKFTGREVNNLILVYFLKQTYLVCRCSNGTTMGWIKRRTPHERIQCEWAKRMRFTNLHSIRLIWSAASAPGLRFFTSAHLSLAFDVIQLFLAQNCTQPLGMEDESISDGQISASSERKRHFGPSNARLNFSGDYTRVAAWMPGRSDPNQWLQVDFGNETRVTEIDTQGRQCGSCHQWVKEYTVSHSRDNVTFHKYKQDGNVKVFFDHFSISTIQDIQGHLGPNSCASYVCVFFVIVVSKSKVFPANSDRGSIVRHVLSPPVVARYIRINPTNWSRYIAMRVEFRGCRGGMGLQSSLFS